ncbi:MAG: trypsin-like peptidase domain-containing protein [Deltaproteobacteria bacterium]|nr:trypsin-like peptidase domain-containing protein [Deltaproteobacteria bacterium]
MLHRASALVAVLAVATCCAASPLPVAEKALRRATIDLGGYCAGVVVSATEILTAAHCVRSTGELVTVTYATGDHDAGHVVSADRASDLAIVRLAIPAPVEPLSIRDGVPAAGETVFFTGRNDFGHPFEEAVIERLGRCPSLPRVPNALFTSIFARPGDSGAPIIDEHLRIVGLVHGGARCHIAAPTAKALGLLAAVHRP